MSNGVISPFFNLSRGTRQGCPLSPLLFTIILEPLTIAIRENSSIKGVDGGGSEHKLMLYANDILFLTRNPQNSLPGLMNAISEYSQLSGYKINWTKSEAMPIQRLLSTNNDTISLWVDSKGHGLPGRQSEPRLWG